MHRGGSETQFLDGVALRKVALPSGAPFDSIGLALGQGSSPLEALIASSAAQPNAAANSGSTCGVAHPGVARFLEASQAQAGRSIASADHAKGLIPISCSAESSYPDAPQPILILTGLIQMARAIMEAPRHKPDLRYSFPFPGEVSLRCEEIASSKVSCSADMLWKRIILMMHRAQNK